MKVTTDACLFGAWCAKEIQNVKFNIQHCLDIGSGTGLLSLMVAQKNDVSIDAIEIEEKAAEQTHENFSISPWSNKLTVINDSLQHATHHQIINYSPDGRSKSSTSSPASLKNTLRRVNYQIIFSNPPFFENDLKSQNDQRNTALHSNDLSFEELFDCADSLLSADGNFYILIPHYRTEETKQIAARFNLFPSQQINVRQTTTHNYFRTMICFNRQKKEFTVEEISIKKENEYTAAFVSLLKDYYLYL